MCWRNWGSVRGWWAGTHTLAMARALEAKAREWDNPALEVPTEQNPVTTSWRFWCDGSLDCLQHLWQRDKADEWVSKGGPIHGREKLSLPHCDHNERSYVMVTQHQAEELRREYRVLPFHADDLILLAHAAYAAVDQVRQRLKTLHKTRTPLGKAYERREVERKLQAVAYNGLMTQLIYARDCLVKEEPEAVLDEKWLVDQVAQRVKTQWQSCQGDIH